MSKPIEHAAGRVQELGREHQAQAWARQIVEQHGGGIELRSQEGQGSTFTVRLPLAPTGAPPGP